MARRRSQWQQFSDNYEAMNSTFNKYFSNKKNREIMDEEVETVYSKDAGLSQHASGEGVGTGTKWRYGGQTYDKQITPSQLTGLRNSRLADVATRYGDAEGAMKMRIDQATLRGLDDQHALDKGTLAERIRAVKLENEKLIKSMDLSTAQINRINTLAPLEASKYIAEIAEQKRSTAEKTAKLPGELTLQDQAIGTGANELTLSDIKLKEFESEKATLAREGGLQLTLDEQANEKIRKRLANKVLTSTYENELAVHIAQSNTNLNDAEIAEMASKVNKQGSETLTEFATMMAEGKFESEDAQKEWLLKAWGENHDPRVRAMIEGMDSMELSQLTVEGAKMTAGVTNALASGSSNDQKRALVKLMDMQDGIEGNMEFVTGDDGVVRLMEYPTKEDMAAKKNGVIRINEAGTDKGWTGFTQQLAVEFTPLKSLEIAKTNAEIKKLNAEAKYKEGQVGEAQKAAQLEQWSKHKDSETYRVSLVKARAEATKNKKDFDLAGWQETYKKNWLADYPVIPEGVQVVETSGLGT